MSVLRSVDLEVHPGEVVAVVGAAAAGKTTLLLCGAGLLRADRGAVSWFGGTPARSGMPRPAGIAYIGDRPFPYGFLTVREAVEYAAIVRELSLGDSGRRADHALERVGLGPYTHRRVDGLDASHSARLAVAMALLGSPRLLLVDALPFGCDAATASELVTVLRGTAAEGGGVVVAGDTLATHALGAMHGALDVRTRLVLLRGGRLTEVSDAAAGYWRSPPTLASVRVAEPPGGEPTLRHRQR